MFSDHRSAGAAAQEWIADVRGAGECKRSRNPLDARLAWGRASKVVAELLGNQCADHTLQGVDLEVVTRTPKLEGRSEVKGAVGKEQCARVKKPEREMYRSWREGRRGQADRCRV